MSSSPKIKAPFPVDIRSTDSGLIEWLSCIEWPEALQLSGRQPLTVYGNDYLRYLLTTSSTELPPLVGALCLTQPFTGSYLEVYSNGICNIIYRDAPLAQEAFILALTASLDPAASHYGSSEFTSVHEATAVFEKQIVAPDDTTNAIDEATSFLAKRNFHPGTAKAVCLCLKEAITNAIFHGFRESGSYDRKYSPEAFHGMYDGDKVSLTLTLGKTWLCATIKDNSGILGPLSVANSLDRHHSNRGLLDERGRGFYLMHHLAHRMIVSVNRRHETCVELYFPTQEPAPGQHHLQMLIR